ncbi:MAG: protoporphyrinogen oxidase [Desulfofustis sp.]|jgi:oxygen-dependent protoporphyrinogen oxidase|nr:protoporphyrinogen oxidase [Desulfofustis sp.]
MNESNDTIDTIIVGGGISGLVVAHRLTRDFPGHRLVVLEKEERPGGVISSFSDNGYLAEWGPHGFLDNCAESRDILRETGLDKECVAASLATFVRYVCINGRLMMIPQSPLKILRAPLIPFRDKIRVLGDLFKKPLDGEPTVAKWAAYRFGHALLPYVDAVFTGTYAGDYNELRIDAVMPGVRELEHRHGSVIRGAIAKARAARKTKRHGEKLTMPAMTSFPGGMQRLPERLAEPLIAAGGLRYGQQVTGLERQENGWAVQTKTERLVAANLVLALPVNAALPLLATVDPALAALSVPEARLATVVFGFADAQLPPGFGYLIPEVEQRFTLGTLFSSNMFPNRAPAGHIVFETLVGGRRHPERVELDEETLIERSLADVRGLLTLPPTPSYAKVLRPFGGIPQLEGGYRDLLRRRNELVAREHGLFICGFGWEGIGLNDMIKTASTLAGRVGSGTVQSQDQAEVKKVYF